MAGTDSRQHEVTDTALQIIPLPGLMLDKETFGANAAGSAGRNSGPRGGLTVSLVSVYNGLLVFALYYLANIMLDDLRDTGRVSVLNWSFVVRSFTPATLTLLFALWLACNVTLVVGSLGFRCWRYGRTKILTKSPETGYAWWNWFWVVAALLLHISMLVVPVWVSYRVNLHASATFALFCEQARLLMKSYSYIREHVRSTLSNKCTNDTLGHLLYFMFAPTLIYRDTFERTPRVRVVEAMRHACIFLLAVSTMIMVLARSGLRPFCSGVDAPLIEETGLRGVPLFLASFWTSTLRLAPTGMLFFTCSAIALHSWNTVFAELMRFSTRGFSQAWWDATSIVDFFRDWNLFVKAWLQKYVFKELLAMRCGAAAARLTTVTVSALFHELALASAFGYFVPFFALLTVIGVAMLTWDPVRLMVATRGNFFMLMFNSFGLGMAISFYLMEGVARLHCTPTLGQFWDAFVPRAVFCELPLRNCTSY